jgi:uncharacterized protein (DUF697 family)
MYAQAVGHLLLQTLGRRNGRSSLVVMLKLPALTLPAAGSAVAAQAVLSARVVLRLSQTHMLVESG